MKNSQKQHNDGYGDVKHYPNFKKILNEKINNIVGSTYGTYDYHLKGSACLDISIIDTYLLHFQSPYNKRKELYQSQYKKLKDSMKPQEVSYLYYEKQINFLSLFYVHFVRYVCYNAVISQNMEIQQLINLLNFQFFRKNKYQSSLGKVTAYLINKIINNECQHLIISFRPNSKAIPTGFVRTKKLYLKIQQNLRQLLQKLQSKPAPEFANNISERQYQMWQFEYFPIGIGKNKQNLDEIVMYTQHTFNKIHNIYNFISSKKIELLQRLKKDVENNLIVNIPQLEKKQSRSKKKQPQKEQKLFNIISVNKVTKSVEPILTDYIDFLAIKSTVTDKQWKDQMPTYIQLAKLIVRTARQYYYNSKTVFPQFGCKDLYFDQKQLKIQLNHLSLIKQGLGLHQDNYSVQLGICQTTPQVINYQACYKQMGKIGISNQIQNQKVTQDDMLQLYRWLLDRKYYLPNMPQQNNFTNQNLQNIESLTQKQRELIQIQKQMDINQLYQNIFVWRLLCVVYYTINDRIQFVKANYQKTYKNIFNLENPPLYKQLFQLEAKRLYESISLDTKVLNQNFKKMKEKQILQNNQQKSKTFNFTMAELQAYLNVNIEQDSLLDEYMFQSKITEMYVRLLVVKETISIFINDKYFKKLINVKKYFIFFFFSSIETAFQSGIMISLEMKKPNSRKQFRTKMSLFKQINFSEQYGKRRKYLQNTYNKIFHEYVLRKESDEQYKYLTMATNTVHKQNMQEVSQYIKRIIQFDQILCKFEIDIPFLDQKDLKIQMEKYQQSLAQSWKLIEKVIKLSYQSMNKLFQDQFQTKFSQINFYHKEDNQSKKEILRLLNLKTMLLLKGYLRLNNRNWQKYSLFVVPKLIQQNNSTKSFKKYDERTKEELQIFRKNLHFVREIIQQDVKQTTTIEDLIEKNIHFAEK